MALLQPRQRLDGKNTRRSARLESDEFEVTASWRVEDDDTLRIDQFLVAADVMKFPTYTAAKKALRKGLVTINKQTIKKIDAVVTKDDLVELHHRVGTAYIKAQNSNSDLGNAAAAAAKVLYEDDFMAIMRKPAGFTFDEINSISLHMLQPPSGEHVEELLRRPAVVHRLDRPVAGVLLLAKTVPSLRSLSLLFSQRAVKKKYIAVVAGKVGEVGDQISIDFPLGDKEALTEVRVDGVDACKASHDGFISTLSVFPQTGRNHQIRRHLSYAGHPIIGDDRYWFKTVKPDREVRRREQYWRAAHEYICGSADSNDDTIGLVSTKLEFAVPIEAQGDGKKVMKVETEPTEVERIRSKLLGFEYDNSER